MKKLNIRLCRVVGIATLMVAMIALAIYVVVGFVDVPENSPLADPSYTICPLNDVSVPRATTLTDAEAAQMPVNQLYGGGNWLTSILFYLALYAIWTLLLVRFIPISSMLNGILLWGVIAARIFSEIAEVIANIFFCYSSLRSGVQSLIDGNHRLRVMIAYIGIWCDDQRHIYAEDVAARITAIIILLISVIAFLIDYFCWSRKAKAESC